MDRLCWRISSFQQVSDRLCLRGFDEDLFLLSRINFLGVKTVTLSATLADDGIKANRRKELNYVAAFACVCMENRAINLHSLIALAPFLSHYGFPDGFSCLNNRFRKIKCSVVCCMGMARACRFAASQPKRTFSFSAETPRIKVA